MHPLLAAIDPGTISALYVFAFAGLAIAFALVGAAVLTRKKDRKSARFYVISAAVCCGVALFLILLALILGNSPHTP
jgi:hypothetical protein